MNIQQVTINQLVPIYTYNLHRIGHDVSIMKGLFITELIEFNDGMYKIDSCDEVSRLEYDVNLIKINYANCHTSN